MNPCSVASGLKDVFSLAQISFLPPVVSAQEETAYAFLLICPRRCLNQNLLQVTKEMFGFTHVSGPMIDTWGFSYQHNKVLLWWCDSILLLWMMMRPVSDTRDRPFPRKKDIDVPNVSEQLSKMDCPGKKGCLLSNVYSFVWFWIHNCYLLCYFMTSGSSFYFM